MTRARRLPRLLLAVGLLVLAAAVPATAATTTIEMKDNVFIPDLAQINPGDTVTWVNKGRSPHNVAYGDKSRESGTIEPGASFSWTFSERSTIYYFCTFHSAGPDSGMAGVLKVGYGGPVIGQPKVDNTGTGGGPQVRRVPAQFPTIQKAVNAANRGDVILVSPGVYKEQVTITKPDITLRGLDRNKVIIDGEFKRPMGVLVQNTKNVVIENLTARYATLNNIYFTGVDGFRASFLTSYNSGDYGIYSFDSQHGVFEDSWASGSRDSGFYIGQCKPCHQVIRRVKATRSGLGYSGTNAGGDLVLTDSEWWDNYGGGITPNTLDSEENPPQSDIVITNNYVHGNHNTDAPYKDPAFASVYGMGIVTAGGDKNIVKNNRVEDHLYFGIIVLPIPGLGPGPADAPVTGNFYHSYDNRVEGNKVSGSGVADLALGAAAGSGNCFTGNTFSTSLPLLIEQSYSCANPPPGGGDPTVSAIAASNLARAESGELAPGDWKTQAVPGAQPTMKDAGQVVFRPIGQRPDGSGSNGSGSGPVRGSSGGVVTGLPRTGTRAPYTGIGIVLLVVAGVWAGGRQVVRRGR